MNGEGGEDREGKRRRERTRRMRRRRRREANGGYILPSCEKAIEVTGVECAGMACHRVADFRS